MRTSSCSRSAWGLLLLRLIVGWVFLSEGVLKFLDPSALGPGRFARIGIPYPHLAAPIGALAESTRPLCRRPE